MPVENRQIEPIPAFFADAHRATGAGSLPLSDQAHAALTQATISHASPDAEDGRAVTPSYI